MFELEPTTIIKGDGAEWLAWHTLPDDSLADLTTGYACQLTIPAAGIDRPVTVLDQTTGFVNRRFVVALTAAEAAAIAVGSYVVSIRITNPAINLRETANGVLTVEAGPPDIVLPTAVDDLKADLEVVRAARIKLASGQMVKDVRRGQRWIVNGIPTLTQLTDLIKILEDEIKENESALAGGAVAGRRRPITFVYGN